MDSKSQQLKKLRELAELGQIKEFQFQEINIREENKIAVGESGQAYRSKIYGQDFTIKVLQQDSLQNSLSQIEKYSVLNHSNILLLQGFCYAQNNLYLIFPFKRIGSLDKAINEINGITDYERRNQIKLQILIDIAKGLKYIHKRQIIHQNLKPQTIQLDDNYNARICDFENSSDFQGSNSRITYTEG